MNQRVPVQSTDLSRDTKCPGLDHNKRHRRQNASRLHSTFFFCCFPGLRGVVFYFLTFSELSGRGFSARYVPGLFCWAGLGTGFAYFVLPTPPLSVGAGLGNRATHLWLRTRLRSCGLGLGGSWSIPCYFLLVLPNPPPAREVGAIWITLITPTGEQDRLVVCANIPLFRRHFLAPPTLRVAW